MIESKDQQSNNSFRIRSLSKNHPLTQTLQQASSSNPFNDESSVFKNHALILARGMKKMKGILNNFKKSMEISTFDNNGD